MQKFEETVTPFIDAGHLLEDSVIAPLAIVSDQESLTCSRRPGTELNLKKFVN